MDDDADGLMGGDVDDGEGGDRPPAHRANGGAAGDDAGAGAAQREARAQRRQVRRNDDFFDCCRPKNSQFSFREPQASSLANFQPCSFCRF